MIGKYVVAYEILILKQNSRIAFRHKQSIQSNYAIIELNLKREK